MNAIDQALPAARTGDAFQFDLHTTVTSDLVASLLNAPPGVVSIGIPLVVSVVALAGVLKRCLPVHRMLLGTWLLSLPVMYLASFWREADGILMLQILPVFSIAAMVMVWRKVDVPVALAYALSFFSLFAIDLLRAVEFAHDHHIPLNGFIQGVGGAGIGDGLFVFPALTAAFVAYGRWRHRTTRTSSRNFGSVSAGVEAVR